MADNNADNNVLLKFLLDTGRATQEQVDQILLFASENKVDVPTAIRETELIGTQDEILNYIAEASGYDYVKLENVEFQREAVNTLEQKKAFNLIAMPYAFEDGALKVAVPIDHIKSVQLKNDLRRITQVGIIQLVVSSKQDILKAIDTQYRSDTELANLSATAVQEQADEREDEISTLGEETGGESDVVRFVDLVLKQGVKDRASDIHFDPQEAGLLIRYRLDGILQKVAEAPSFMIPEIVSRVKIMSELDISKTREPQDGRLSMSINGKDMDFRVATLPSVYGEKIVMRILDNSSARLKLEDLGFSVENLDRFYKAARKPYGVLLVTGPTGSGKSTTLYAALNVLNSPDVNIITAEDPVEYTLPGITQVPVRHPMTFEKVLRTVLRADPDIVLIGEIRDRETAEIAMKAGMTGHMVFSTLHTNDAATALTRLSDMGVQAFITASTVEAIVSQRLIRRLCAKCKQPGDPTDAELESIGFTLDTERDGEPTWYRPVGCKTCNKSGYKGRMAIHEVLLMDEILEEAVIGGAKAFELNKLAMSQGMISLKEDGFRKAAKGLTTLQEIMRVVN